MDKVTSFLSSKKREVVNVENNVVLNGADTIKNILYNETIKVGRYDIIISQLLDKLTDAKMINKLPYKEKLELLKVISATQSNSRDFIFKVAELSAKNEFLKQVLEVTQKPHEVLVSECGEQYVSGIDEETRKNLTEVLRDIINERVRNS